MGAEGLLPILECGDPVLRRRADPVEPAELKDPELQRLIARMRATMKAAPGVGLAAPQVGESIQLAVLQDGPELWGQLDEAARAARERQALPFTVLVNPVARPVEEAGQASFYEGCLSVPGLAGVVTRWRSLLVEGLDEHGRAVERLFTGWPARIVQHELDHLEGRLFLDRVETRSLSTPASFARFWADRPTEEAAARLGFPLAGPAS